MLPPLSLNCSTGEYRGPASHLGPAFGTLPVFVDFHGPERVVVIGLLLWHVIYLVSYQERS